VTCEFGDSPIFACDEVDRCKEGRWQQSVPDLTDPACAAASVSCPGAYSGKPCTVPNAHCDLGPQGRCECDQNAPVSGWPSMWRCTSLPGDARCPASRPRTGTPCDSSGILCSYNACVIRGGNRQKCQPVHDVATGLYPAIWVDRPVQCGCPATMPMENSSCTNAGLSCEYGSSPILGCDTLATCIPRAMDPSGGFGDIDGVWTLQKPDGGLPCLPAPAGDCPSPDTQIQGQSCDSYWARAGSPGPVACDYGDKRCECADGPSVSTITWRCSDPLLAGPGCGARPRVGSPCPQDGLICNYGTCEITGGVTEICEGRWIGINQSCTVLACPDRVPQAGEACSYQQVCEYGSSDVPTCNRVAVCWAVPWLPGWIVSDPDAGGASCRPLSKNGCPPTFESVPRGASCAGGPSLCDYPHGRCRCAATTGTSNPIWSCQDPALGCPRPRERLGSSCTQEGLVCTYGSCESADDSTQICRLGVWAPLGCHADAGSAVGPG
jgi:hypothetical protein